MSVIFKRLEESVVVEGDAANQCGGEHLRGIDRRQREGLDEEPVAIEERGENSSKVPKDRDKETSSTCTAQEESLQHHDQGIAQPQLQQQQQQGKFDLKTELEREAYGEDEPLEEAPGLSHNQQEQQQQQSLLYKIKHRIPHLYYITTHLLLPLMTLIGMAFLFGGMLAKIEMKEEILRNDAAAADIFVKYVDHIADRQTIRHSIANISVQCLASSHAGNNMEDLWEGAGMSPQQEKQEQDATYNNITTCAAQKAQERFPITDILLFLVRSETPLTFNWMKCYDNNTIGDANATSLFLKRFGLNEYGRYDQQLALYLHRFGTNWDDLKNKSGIPDEQFFANQQLMSELVGKTTGSAGCQVHWAGGALFWFTVMTTIGYGNAAPTTDEGRLLVYTAGFVTIILFLVLNNTAAYFWKHIFEHFFLKCNLTFLVTGPLSVLFWLSMTFLWMLVVAFGAVAYEKNVGRETFSLKDAYWFSYITITTVGFGDIHAEHEDFGVLDMFHFPLLVLVGFNFLGIFAEKAVDLYNHHFPEDRGYPDILEERRRSEAAGKTNKQQQETAPSPDAQLLGVTTIMEC